MLAACIVRRAVALIGLATAAQHGWLACLFTLLSDLLACHAVATVAGFGGGVAAAASDMVIAPFIGLVLQAIGSCVPVFLMVGAAYILALAVVHRLVPRRQPVRVEQPA
ncbi:hypothetical protein [Xanthomonas axonopodis]|uniref:MFS transporter n=1 Tax=Xanthomonas axonopodis pv. cajani TaxID=487827 RepID=A0ABX3MB63_9XANT|nr:hypothetical protein Xcaj_09115 [Xanthomonas axonopodis pv. cajani]